jgi:undecaprenyl-diphosphatase
MLEYLKDLDTRLLLIINGAHSATFDFIMFWLSDKLIWIPMYLFLVWQLYKLYGKKVWLILIFAGMTAVLSDWGSVQLFKNTIQRLRPCHEPALEGLLHLINGKCGGQYGFVSSHAANTFGVAFFCFGLFTSGRTRYLAKALIVWAALVSFSRIYLGVHYPLDVLAGAGWGVLCGTAMVLSAKRFIQLRPE